MVGVDVQPHAAVAFGAGVEGADRAQRLGQHHAHAAVQDANGWRVRSSTGTPAQEVVADFGDFDAQVGGRGVLAGLVAAVPGLMGFFQIGMGYGERPLPLSCANVIRI